MSEATPAESLPTPQYWIALITGEGTTAWARPEQIVAYGDAPVGQGSSWIQFDGTSDRVYLLQTVGELHTLLGNNDAISQQATAKIDARDRVRLDSTGQGQTE